MKVQQRYPRAARYMRTWLPIALTAMAPAVLFLSGHGSAEYARSLGAPAPQIAYTAAPLPDPQGLAFAAPREGSGLDDLLLNETRLEFPKESDLKISDSLFGDIERKQSLSVRLHSTGLRRWAHDKLSQGVLHKGLVAMYKHLDLSTSGHLGHYPDLAVFAPTVNVSSPEELQTMLKPTYQFDGNMSCMAPPDGVVGAPQPWMMLSILQVPTTGKISNEYDPTNLNGENLAVTPRVKGHEL